MTYRILSIKPCGGGGGAYSSQALLRGGRGLMKRSAYLRGGANLRGGGDLFERGGLFISGENINYMIILLQHKEMCVNQICILTILTQL